MDNACGFFEFGQKIRVFRGKNRYFTPWAPAAPK